MTEGGAAEAIDSETHSYSPQMTSLAASYIVRRRLLEDQTQHALELALRGQLRSGDLPEVPGGNVGVRVAVYRVIEEIERFSPELEFETLSNRGGFGQCQIDRPRTRPDERVASQRPLPE